MIISKSILSLDKRRKVILKNLVESSEGAVLRNGSSFTVIEPDIDIWNRIYDKDDQCYLVNQMNLTYKCNQNCSYCFCKQISTAHAKDLTLEQAKEALLLIPSAPFHITHVQGREIFTSDYRDFPMIRLTGGEITCWEPLSEFLHFVLDNRYNYLVLLTNGIKLMFKDYLNSLPQTSRICWCITVKDDSLRTRQLIDNIAERGYEYAFNIIYYPDDVQRTTKLFDMVRKYAPQEVRIRVLVDLRGGGISAYQSDLIKFICNYFRMSVDYYFDKCYVRDVYATQIQFQDIGEHFSVRTVLNPTWKTIILDEAVKSKTWLLSIIGKLKFDTLLVEAMNESVRMKHWRIKR